VEKDISVSLTEQWDTCLEKGRVTLDGYQSVERQFDLSKQTSLESYKK